MAADGEAAPPPPVGGDRSCLEHLVALLPSPTSHGRGQVGAPEELQRRALYALSAALRGNTDVQEALLGLAPGALGWAAPAGGGDIGEGQEEGSAFVAYLAYAAAPPIAAPTRPGNATGQRGAAASTSAVPATATAAVSAAVEVAPEVRRKVWAVVADMLEERAYVRQELAASPDLPPGTL